ncbi:AP-5 complex subunit beta-1 [Camellia lanceoleosa]|uniref:AP-5 complex subunit beta-1 n=1 Tax=Camellia lanceoleosa TaxID=1840588 RepID=A0ACC0G155_9ERIC|nr:AP-5 complex subunit beta-1 [Camellia lanceoleosa]
MEKPPPLKPLSTLEWEALIDDFHHGGSRLHRWTSSNYSGLSLLELSLSTILRKDFPLNLKLHLIIFLETHFSDSESDSEVLTRLLETLRVLIQAPIDGVSVTFALKEQMMVSTSSVFITLRIDDDDDDELLHIPQLESLTELLLMVVNRPNHGPDRQTRSVACECLRELERAYPCLLSEIVGNLWGLCQSERTHASQSYVLLLTSVIHGIVMLKPNVSILNSSIPLVPFNVPQFLVSGNGGFSKEISGSSYKELRRVLSFLLDCPMFLTSFGLVEFMSMILPVAVVLELQGSLLKVQFSGLLYTYDPLMCHAFLMMYKRFRDAFNGQEGEIARRLILISREAQQYLVFRLIALHWLLGFIGLLSNGEVGKKKAVLGMGLSFYPTVFDPLSLKSLKLDLLAYCSILFGEFTSANEEGVQSQDVGSGLSVVKLFEDGLVSVLAFKWLPPWSTETAVAFRTFHKFLIGASSHSDTDPSSTRILMASTIFSTLQRTLVELILEFKGLVPVIVALVDRFFGCHKHCWLGERLLQTFDEQLLPKVKIDYRLSSYFPIFDRIAENDTVPPGGLLELLIQFMIFLVEKHGPDVGLKSWSQGSRVLGICRTMLMHHHSSRLFLGLSRLLAFTCLYFPDLELRDDARIYLRMLICIPGKKLRDILKSGEQLPGITPSPQSSSYFSVQSPQPSFDLKKSRTISSYIFIERMIPLLVKQSWSLSLSTLNIGVDKPAYLEGIGDSEPLAEQSVVDEDTTNIQICPEIEKIDHPHEPLRVMDSKISEIIGMLRRHFSTIPDFRHMPGLKIRIPCSLRFLSEPFKRIWGIDLAANGLDGLDALPAFYATVLRFSSSAPYGSIPSNHIPFLLGEPPIKDYSSGLGDSLAIVPIEDGSGEEEEESFKATVTIELEPREPIPGLVDVSIEANTENGQIIRGQLQSINIGIEDMFLRAIIPSDIPEDEIPSYYLDLFNALWEACGSSTNTGHETFPLKGGKGVAAISGTRSVKLLQVPAASLIQAIEHHLAPFVVSVLGEPLVNIVKNCGIIKDVIWKDDVASDSTLDDAISGSSFSKGPLYLKYVEDEGERENHVHISKKNLGSFLVLIFLPPRFHLLFQMEVCDVSTLVRIRTDHWPCLAYIDDYLEALFFE